MSAPEPTLAEMIREAGRRYDAMVIVGDPEVRGVRRHEYQAAAVTAWASTDAAVERMAEAIDPMAFNQDDPRWARGTGEMAAFLARERVTAREKARAAVAALLGAREEDGDG